MVVYTNQSNAVLAVCHRCLYSLPAHADNSTFYITLCIKRATHKDRYSIRCLNNYLFVYISHISTQLFPSFRLIISHWTVTDNNSTLNTFRDSPNTKTLKTVNVTYNYSDHTD